MPQLHQRSAEMEGPEEGKERRRAQGWKGSREDAWHRCVSDRFSHSVHSLEEGRGGCAVCVEVEELALGKKKRNKFTNSDKREAQHSQPPVVIETLTLAESVLSSLQPGANEKWSFGVTAVCFEG